jgi:iron(III) transport system substrate-binding protein
MLVARPGFRRPLRGLVLGALATLVLAPIGWAPVAESAGEIVVYSSRHYGQEPALELFTRKTGIAIKMFNASDAELFERLKAEGDRTPADVLLTVDAGNLWNAARAGLLAPVDSRELQVNIPPALRDAQHRWFALAVRARTIMYSAERVKPHELSTYAALGDPRWKGRLCLRQSSHVYNQSLLAGMIKRHGEARTEEIVRGWVANQPTLISSDTKILEAIAAGQCDVGLTNTYYLARLLQAKPDFPVRLFWADQSGPGVHVNVSGGGVTAHARHRTEAIRFLEFLSTVEAQTAWAEQSLEFPANPAATPSPIVARWGAFKMDDAALAAAGELQPAATRLADRVGYR